jgi:imidazole glycerol-phosphate synthase subunit HisH
MKFDVAIVDYGMGNLGSVHNALSFLGLPSRICDEPDGLAEADALILPGVGAFGEAMHQLTRRRLIAPLERHAVAQGRPLLGICLGMQLLAERSYEHGTHRGLGWLPGEVLRLPDNKVIVPHVGWSEVTTVPGQTLFDGIERDACFYFDHGYHLVTAPELVTATVELGGPRIAAVRSGAIFACQFHPEKSQRSGLKLLRNFLRLCIERQKAAA